MKFTVKQFIAYDPSPIALRCPHCGREAAMVGMGANDIDIGDGIYCGQRICPSPGCKGHIFLVHRHGNVLESYPPTTIDFDSNGIPENIVSSFEEAIRCHSVGCFMASALMVRRTLEEVCLNKGATGGNLKQRIADLKGKIVIPNEMFEAMEELRLLGNDAAHIEARSYDKISNEELGVAIEFTKELLKALYQYSDLLEKLRGLKKTP